jgi:hypothetical protein
MKLNVLLSISIITMQWEAGRIINNNNNKISPPPNIIS